MTSTRTKEDIATVEYLEEAGDEFDWGMKVAFAHTILSGVAFIITMSLWVFLLIWMENALGDEVTGVILGCLALTVVVAGVAWLIGWALTVVVKDYKLRKGNE